MDMRVGYSATKERDVAKTIGRPPGSANTTGWEHRTISFRPAILREIDREARRRGVSRSGMINGLVAIWLDATGKGKVVERAERRTYAGEN